jgi:hypothetical protein
MEPVYMWDYMAKEYSSWLSSDLQVSRLFRLTQYNFKSLKVEGGRKGNPERRQHERDSTCSRRKEPQAKECRRPQEARN